MAGKFDDKVVWITGGGSGIGEAMAREFVRWGAKVAISGRRVEKLDQAVERLADMGGDGLAVPCDVTDEDQVKEAVAKVVEHYGRLDVSVANAGFGVTGPVEKLEVADWKRQLDTNVLGLVSTVKHSLPELKKNNGRVVLIGSVAGCISMPFGGPYHASKYAVRSIGQVLSMELHGTGVSCTNIQPGFVESEIFLVDKHGKIQEDWKDKRPRRFIWKAEKAARVMVKAVYKRRREYTFTGHGKFAAFLGKHFPGLVHFVVTRMGVAKKSKKYHKEGATDK